MNFADRLKLLREQKGLTQEDLAKRLNISRSALSLWEIGKREPNHETLKRLADFFGVTVDYLLGNDRLELADILGNEQITLTEGGEILPFEKRKKLIQAIKYPDKLTKSIPILGQIRAGLPILTEENYEGGIEIPSDITADFALRVRGDSMIGAGILDGDFAICRKAETINAYSGQIVVAVRYETAEYAEATLKYFFVENGRAVLRAANPDYEDIDFDEEGYHVAGIMVALLRYGAPDYRIYREYISTRDYALQEWDEVIEKATAAGIKASVIKELIDVQVEIAKRLKG